MFRGLFIRKGKREKIDINISSVSIPHSIFLRADASVAIEIVAEEGGAGEVVLVSEGDQGDVY